MVNYIEHFDRVGSPVINKYYYLTIKDNNNYVTTPTDQLLDFSKPFKFRINFNTITGTGHGLFPALSGDAASGLSYYLFSNSSQAICTIGDGTAFNDIWMKFPAGEQNNFVLEWDGNTYTSYVEMKDGTIGQKYTLERSTPIPNCVLAIGKFSNFVSNLKNFSLEHKDGTYKFELVSRDKSSTISEKLIQLGEAKNLIKEAIIKKGVYIDSNTPFVEYADKINAIEGRKITNFVASYSGAWSFDGKYINILPTAKDSGEMCNLRPVKLNNSTKLYEQIDCTGNVAVNNEFSVTFKTNTISYSSSTSRPIFSIGDDAWNEGRRFMGQITPGSANTLALYFVHGNTWRTITDAKYTLDGKWHVAYNNNDIIQVIAKFNSDNNHQFIVKINDDIAYDHTFSSTDFDSWGGYNLSKLVRYYMLGTNGARVSTSTNIYDLSFDPEGCYVKSPNGNYIVKLIG